MPFTSPLALDTLTVSRHVFDFVGRSSARYELVDEGDGPGHHSSMPRRVGMGSSSFPPEGGGPQNEEHGGGLFFSLILSSQNRNSLDQDACAVATILDSNCRNDCE